MIFISFCLETLNHATLQPLKDLIKATFILKAYYNKIVLTWLQKIFANHLNWLHHISLGEWINQHCVLIIDSFTVFHQVISIMIDFKICICVALKLPFLMNIFICKSSLCIKGIPIICSQLRNLIKWKKSRKGQAT